MNTETKTPGQIAMDAHRKSLIPTRGIIAAGYEFETMPQDTQAAWEAAAQAARAPLQAELDDLKRILSSPAAVWTNMLRGTIAQPQAFHDLDNLRAELRTAQEANAQHVAEHENFLGSLHNEEFVRNLITTGQIKLPKECDDVTECARQLGEARKELEASEKAAAALRNALLNLCEKSESGVKHCPECSYDIEHHDAQCLVGHALARDAGKNLVHICEVEPMVGVLESALFWVETDLDSPFWIKDRNAIAFRVKTIKEALADWRKNHPKPE